MEYSQEKRAGLNHVRFADEELIKTQVLQGEAAQTIIQGENCSVYKWRIGRTPGPTCWRSITAGLAGLSVNFQMGARSIWERVIWPSMS